MMKYTENYNFRKPEDIDPVDIQDLNYNTDAIDGKLKEIEDWEAAHLQASNPHSITPALIGAETPTGAQQKANQAETNAKNYADQVASDLSNQAETNAKSYADIVANGALNSAKDYADIVTNSALNSAKDYADIVTNSALNSARDYADDVLESANSHTDQVASDLSQKVDETKIKVLDVEQDVSNITKALTNLNPDQEAKQSVSGYRILSLPKNAANRQISGVELKGLTATNLVKNGDFRNGIDDFVFTSGSPGLNRELKDGCLYFESNTNNLARIRYNVALNTGDIYYLKAIIKASKPNIAYLILGNNVSSQRNTTTDWEAISIRGTKYNWNVIEIILDKSSSSDETHSVYVKYVILVNLTQVFGAGNEPNKAECDNIFSNYFEGTKSTLCAFRIRSVSQDESQESAAYVLAKDAEGKIVELRSLPNGTKDEIRVSGGKAELVKRVSNEWILNSSDIVNFGEYEETDYVTIQKKSDMAIYEDTTLANIESVNIEGYKPITSGWQKAENAYSYYNIGLYQIRLVLPKGLYTDTQSARTGLAGTIITYQLAETIIAPINVSGNLISYPSGTVYVENVVADAGIYTDKMTVLHQDLPIKVLEKLSKIDFITGLETELDVSDAVIAENKLSFTHPDIVDGDIVFFTYEYGRESTKGETKIEYYDSRYVIKDSVTEKFYKWHIAVADGVPSIELTEV